MLACSGSWAHDRPSVVGYRRAMRFEHVALNIPDTEAAKTWYCEHLGMKVVGTTGSAYFLGDETGRSVFEFYTQTDPAPPVYREISKLTLHIAFVSEDLEAERSRLEAAGATRDGEISGPADGDQLLFMRDPWGVTLQFVKRRKALE